MLNGEFKFGDPITNVCAGPDNPRRHAFFVEMKYHLHKNKYGVTHTTRWARCTNGAGEFWNTDPKVIFPGHLSYEESERLYKPIWEAEHGGTA